VGQGPGDQRPDPVRIFKLNGPGDYLEFFAEIDLLCALSACPGGDLSVGLWGPQAADPFPTCQPLAVEVYDVDPALLDGWLPPRSPDYRGRHGLRDPGD